MPVAGRCLYLIPALPAVPTCLPIAMLTLPRLLLILLAALPVLAGCSSSPDADPDAHAPVAAPAASGDQDTKAGLLTAFHAMTQRLAAARPALAPDQEAARQLVEYHRGALALAAVEAHQGRDSTLRRRVAAFAQGEQRLLPPAEALAVRLAATAAARPALRQRLQATVSQLVKREEASRVEAAGRQAQAPNLGMMQSHQDDGTGDVDADFVAVMLLQQRAVQESAQAMAKLGSAPELKTAAAEVARRAQDFIPELQAWQGQHRPVPKALAPAATVQ
jgi:uncharacterized protein (DUF305 family)